MQCDPRERDKIIPLDDGPDDDRRMTYYYCYQQPQQPCTNGEMASNPSSGLSTSVTVATATAAEAAVAVTPPATATLLTPVLLAPNGLLPSPSSVGVLMTPNTISSQHHHNNNSNIVPTESPTAAAVELHTPNTFLRHCDDLGLFHDLLRADGSGGVFVQQQQQKPVCDGDDGGACIPVAKVLQMTTTAMTTTPGPPTLGLFGSATSSAASLVMANPFDETFRRAVVLREQQDGSDVDVPSNKPYDNSGDLNTPFIRPSQQTPVPSALLVETDAIRTTTTTAATSITSDNCGNSVVTSLSVTAAPTNIVQTTDVVMKPQAQDFHRQNVFVTPIETATGEPQILFMLMQQQPTDSQNRDNVEGRLRPLIARNGSRGQQQLLVSASETSVAVTSNCNTATPTTATMIKKALKNTLVNRLQQAPAGSEQQDLTISQNYEANNGCDMIVSDNDDDQNDEELQRQRRQLQLERNKSAARRSRAKRKHRWELLQAENRRLRVENLKLRAIIEQKFQVVREVPGQTVVTLTNVQEPTVSGADVQQE